MGKSVQLTIPQLKTAIATYVAKNKIAADFTPTYNLAGLLDTIGKIYTNDQLFIDKLADFDGEFLSFGKTVEEWAIDLILPKNTDDLDDSEAISSAFPNYMKTAFSFDLGSKTFKTTYKYNELNKGVHNEGQLTELIYGIQRSLTNSVITWRYAAKRELAGRCAEKCVDEMNPANAQVWAQGTARSVGTLVKSGSSGNVSVGIVVKDYATTAAIATYAAAVEAAYVVTLDLVRTLAKPTDTATGEAFVKAIKTDVEAASDLSEGNSLNGNTLGATQGLTLLVKQGLMPTLEVDVQAGAFNTDKVAVPAKIITLPDFGKDVDENVYAILLDNRGFRMFPTWDYAGSQPNEAKGFMNYFRHTDNTAHISKNTFIKVYKNA